jgi:predicted ATPase
MGHSVPPSMPRYAVGPQAHRDPERLIVVSGCSGGGKSALIDELGRRGHAVRGEPGRQIVREQLAVDGAALPWKDAALFVELMLSRASYLYNTASTAEGWVFFDRSMIDHAAALGEAPDREARLCGLYRYASTVFFAPPWPELFEQDEERRHSFDAACAEYERLARAYPQHGYEIVELPRDSVAARADFVEQQLAAQQ